MSGKRSIIKSGVGLGKISLLFCLVFSFQFSQSENQTDPPDEKIAALREKAASLMFQDPDLSLKMLDSALFYAQKGGAAQQYGQLLDLKDGVLGMHCRFPEWKKNLAAWDEWIAGKAENDRDFFRAKLANRRGIYFYELGQYQEALKHLQAASDYYESQPPALQNCSTLFSTRQFIAVIYRRMGALDSAIEEFRHSFRYYECYRDTTAPPDYSVTFIHIAQTYLQKGDTLQAGTFFEKALKNAEQHILPDQGGFSRQVVNIYNPVSHYYIVCEKLDSAIRMLKKTLPFVNDNDPFSVHTYTLLGDAHNALNQFDQALAYYREAEARYQKLLGNKNYRLGVVHQKMGGLMEKQNRLDEAIAYYQRSLCNLAWGFEDSTNIYLNPVLQKITGKPELIQSLYLKAKLFDRLSGQRNDPDALLAAFETASLAVSLIDSTKYDLIKESERRFQAAGAYPVYELAVDLAIRLYQSDEKYAGWLEKAFALVEQSRGFTLLEVVNQTPAFIDIDPALLEKEKQIKAELAKVEQQLYDLRLQPNSAQQQTLENRFATLQHDLAEWVFEIRTAHPDYFNLKFDNRSVSLSAVQQELLSPHQTMIEYFWGENFLFTFLIRPDTVQVWKQPLLPLADSIRLFKNLIVDPASRLNLRENVHFQELSYFLFKGLLEKLMTELGEDCDKLIIARDGLLEYIPFELLDRSRAVGPNSFVEDDFLIRGYDIAYAQSATLLHRQTKRKPDYRRRNLLGFAPSYTEAGTDAGRGEYADLPGAEKEIEEITRIAGGKPFMGVEATEQNFKKYAHRYKILHLALHGRADDVYPQFSELVFTPSPGEDGKLRAIELYNMRLNAQLAVLSGCETGYGKLQRGEGLLSLGHAFAYAGAPSIVVSQWKVPDASTAEIMISFYNLLKKGYAKDEALAGAKKLFLENHPELAHPFFWAGFVVSGNTAPVGLGFRKWLHLFVALAFGAVFFILFRTNSFFILKKKS